MSYKNTTSFVFNEIIHVKMYKNNHFEAVSVNIKSLLTGHNSSLISYKKAIWQFISTLHDKGFADALVDYTSR
ncbi:hypothetical protein C0T31_11275 [Dysgonamonadaceae bacterium]|nr:hypothetical protein C0T31_11275 [Dysgonamonadaceae bacterium]